MGTSGLPQTGVELVAANLQGFLGDLQKGNAAVGSFGNDMESAGGRTTSASQVIIGGLRQVGSMAVDALAKAGRALISFGQDSLQLAGDFQSGMQQFQVAAGQDLDTQGLQQFHDLFIQLGKDLPVSTGDVQQAAIEMVKGGIDPAILAAGGLKQNIQFAAAAMSGDLVGAAEISAKIVAGWADTNATAADKAELLGKATDLLTKAANASSVDVKELSLGLFNVQATAKNAGISLDDVTTVLAELSGDFASSSQAGNSMASFISRLQPTTTAATDAMMSLGLVTKDGGNVFYDAEGKFVGLRAASGILKDAFKDLTDQQRQSIMQTIFQKDAMGVAAGLAQRGVEGYDAMAASLGNAMGVTQAGQTVQAGYNTALENASGSIEALKITIGEAFLPVLTDLLNTFVGPGVSAITTFAGTFSKMLPAILASSDPIQSFLNAIKIAAPSALDFVSAIEGWKDSLMQLQEPLTTFTNLLIENLPTIEAVVAALSAFIIIDEIAGWITGVIGSITALGTAFTAAGGGISGVIALLGGPVTLAIAGVALAIGGLVLAWQNNWGDIQGKTAGAWAQLEPIFTQLGDWLQVKVPEAAKVLTDFWSGTLWPAFQTVGAFIEGTIFPILGDLANVWLAVAKVEVSALSTLWTNALWPALKVVGSFISDVLWPIFKALFEVEFAIASKVVEALAGLWQKVLWPALKSVGDYITNSVLPVFTKVGTYLSSTFSPLLESVTNWLGKITGGFNGVSGAVDYVIDKIKQFGDSVSKLKLPSWLTPGSPTPWEIALYGIGKALNTSVAPGLGLMRQGVTAIGDQISNTFKDSDVINNLENLGLDAMAGFAQGIKSGIGAVSDVINSTADTVEEAFNNAFDSNSPSRRMMPVGGFVSSGFLQGMVDMWPSVTSTVADLGDSLVQQAETIMREVQDSISGSFKATASLDRQKFANIGAVNGLDPTQQANVQAQLDAAEKISMAMNDPEQAAAYFQMRSKQIMELANMESKLKGSLNAQQMDSYEKQIKGLERNTTEVQAMVKAGIITQEQADAVKVQNEKTIAAMREEMGRNLTSDQRADLEAQIALITAAQKAEQQAFQSSLGQGSTAELINKLQDFLLNTDIGILENPVIGQLNSYLEQLRNGTSGTADVTSSPPATPAQQAGWQAAPPSNVSSTRNYNMPVYTNNTVAALQQSFALLQAATGG